MKQPMVLTRDIILSGQVSWVGSSSMEIRVRMHYADAGGGGGGGANNEEEEDILVSYFNFVAREQGTGKAAQINSLDPQTAVEQAWFAEGARRSDMRREARRVAQSLVKDEQQLLLDRQRHKQIQTMLDASRPFATLPALAPRDTVLIEKTVLTNTLVTQPQHQNTAGRVFGGFLMRRAFEIAFSCAYIFR
jgi:acyl-coenzyme A thioesterase 9